VNEPSIDGLIPSALDAAPRDPTIGQVSRRVEALAPQLLST
jgi:hypothetical protein